MKIDQYQQHCLRFRQLLVGSLIVLLVSCQSPTPSHGFPIRVERVISGKELEIVALTGEAIVQRAELIGVDAPDVAQIPWGEQAKNRLEQLANSGSSLELQLKAEIQTKDDTHLLVYLWQGNKLLNQQLIEEGLALALPKSPHLKYAKQLIHAQEKARLMGLGLWNPRKPMRQTPSEFRGLELSENRQQF